MASKEEEDNIMTLLTLGPMIFGLLGAVIWAKMAGGVNNMLAWMLTHDLLVPAQQALLPLNDQAGLDLLRCALYGLILVLVIAVPVATISKHLQKKRETA